MWRKKDKGKDSKDSGRGKEKGRGRGGDNLASMLGMGGMDNFDMDEGDLEAELLALEGKKPSGKKGSKGGGGQKRMTMEEINKLAMESSKDIDLDDPDMDDDDDDDFDESDLLAELEGFEDDDNEDQFVTARGDLLSQPQSKPLQNSLQVIMERIELYQSAVKESEKAGESSKVRRYKRALDGMQNLAKKAKSGGSVDLDELPPVINVKGVSTQEPPPPQPQQELTRKPLTTVTPTPAPTPAPKPAPTPATKPAPTPATKPAPTPAPKPAPTPAPKTAPTPAPKPDSSSQPVPKESDHKALARAILVERYKQYQEVSQKAKAQGDLSGSKKNALMAARFARVIKGFAAGNPIDISQMPPPPPGYSSSYNVDLKELSQAVMEMTAQSQPTADQPKSEPMESQKPPPPSGGDEEEEGSSDPSIPIPKSPQEALEQRLAKYKSGVEAATKEGNSGKARRMGRIVKQYEDALKALKAGRTVEYSELPTPPGYPPIPVGAVGKPQPPPVAAPRVPMREEVVNSSVQRSTAVVDENEDETSTDPTVPQPTTAMEALQQRHAKYKSSQDAAQAEGNGSKARRMGRIVKQYEDAMKDLKAGKTVDFEELPTPPGFPPIPVGGAKTTTPPQRGPSQPTTTASSSQQKQVGRNAQQIALLQQRHTEYKAAAIKHRDANDRAEALRLLKYVKDLDAHLDLARKGLPIDETAIPPPLEESDDTPTKPLPPPQHKKAKEGDEGTFELIENQIQKQIDFCDENAEVYEKAGNRAGASRLRNMSEECKQELLAIKGIQGQGLAPPHFTLETRTVNLLNSFPHLSSSECEVEVVKLLDAPKDQTVYVEIEFPYPSDDNPKEQTPKTKDEVNPELKSVHVFPIERKQKRSLARALSRGMKMTLWHHKALWKDNAIGTAVVKAEELENKAEVRQVVSFYDGRKELSPKVEVAVRLREPLSGADVEEKQVQWIVFMEQIVKKSKVVMPKAKAPAEPDKKGASGSGTKLSGPVKLEETFSISALKLEYQIAQKDPELQDKIKKKMQTIQQKLQTDRTFAPNYKKGVEASLSKETKLYQQYAKAGRQTEAKILQERVKAMQLELRKL